MVLALRRALGIWTSYADAYCPYHGNMHQAHPVDSLAATHHAITCPLTGLQNTMHHDVARCVRAALKLAHVPPSAIKEEEHICFDGPRAAAARAAAAADRPFIMDIVVRAGGLSSAGTDDFTDKAALIDVTIPNPCSVTAIAGGAAQVAGTAANAKEVEKRNKYHDTFLPASATLVCLALETYGRLGLEAERFVKAVARHGARSAGVNESLLTVKLYQTLSVGLQRALSRREFAYVDKLRARGVLPRGAQGVDDLWDMFLDGGVFDAADELPPFGVQLE